ncbi:general substrate transporter [Macrolepiota fuliginosa MF-IS2]|uniref:General substrate transporter n=1 Tax=Macrolepiota fuliginosa MF-IS2 TaxID=1400762 RepID=A0A9P5X308_9AGAR|nr:general substrate transporter [Macrolepiota fuliginosa MF-IS2]
MSTQEVGYSVVPQEGEGNNARADQSLLLSSEGGHALGQKIDMHRGGSFVPHSDGSYNYSYGPGGLAGLRHNRYAFLCAFFASIGGLEFGYDQGVIANVLVMKDFVNRWPVTPLQKGIMTAVLELGALVGALCAGIFADRLDRRKSIVVACIVFCIGSAFQCGAITLSHLFVGRAIGGVGVGALSMLSPLYMAEISAPEVRGSLLALEQFSIVLGVVIGFWTGFGTRNIPGPLSWRLPLGIQLIPGIILALGCFFLPPSPRLLVLQGRYGEASASLAKLRLRTPEEAESDPLLQIELLEMKVEATLIQQTSGRDLSKSGCIGELKSWEQLFSPRYRDRTMIGVMIMVFQQWSGINALLYYGPTLVRSIGLSGDTVTLLVSGGIGIVQFLAVFPAIIYIDKFGRKPLLRGGSAAMMLSHFLIASLVFLFQSDWASHSVAAWTAVGGIYTFTYAYGVSIGPIAWVLTSEVFPLSMRGKGIALSTASNWFNNFIIGLVTPVIMEMSPSFTFIVFSAACFFAYLWATYVVPETANVSLEEVDAVFNSPAGRDDAMLKQQIELDLGLHDLVQELASDDHHH